MVQWKGYAEVCRTIWLEKMRVMWQRLTTALSQASQAIPEVTHYPLLIMRPVTFFGHFSSFLDLSFCFSMRSCITQSKFLAY